VGIKLVGAGYALCGLVAELEAAGQQFITTDALLVWATRPASASSGWWSQRLQMGRSFARFLHALDSRHQVPPPGLLPRGPARRLPLADSTRAALAAYARLRDAAIARPEAPAFFRSRLGKRPGYGIVQSTFATLLPAAGLEDRPRLRPRLHDLRHGFAVATVT